MDGPHSYRLPHTQTCEAEMERSPKEVDMTRKIIRLTRRPGGRGGVAGGLVQLRDNINRIRIK